MQAGRRFISEAGHIEVEVARGGDVLPISACWETRPRANQDVNIAPIAA
jgi:hypothetical protein